MTPRIDLFKKYVLRIVFKYDSQNWTYFSALSIEWNIWEYDSKELNFFWNNTWQKELNTFLIWPKRLNFFFVIWPQRLNFSDVTQRIEHFFECESKNWTFYQHDSKNWTLKFNLTQRIEPSSQMDSKNWTLKRLFQKCITVLWLMSKSSQVFESCKKSSILWVIFKKGSIIWSEIFEKSILWFKFEKVQFLE